MDGTPYVFLIDPAGIMREFDLLSGAVETAVARWTSDGRTRDR